MLRGQKSGISIRDIVTFGNDEGFRLPIVIINGQFHGALPHIGDSGTTMALDDFVGLDQITHKMFSDIGNASRASVVNAKVQAVSVKRCFLEDNSIMGWSMGSRKHHQRGETEEWEHTVVFSEFDSGFGECLVMVFEGKQLSEVELPVGLLGLDRTLQLQMQLNELFFSRDLCPKQHSDQSIPGVGPRLEQLTKLVCQSLPMAEPLWDVRRLFRRRSIIPPKD